MAELLKDQGPVFEVICETQMQGLCEHIDGPQIIMVGDRSAGKTSVLEAISGIRFPVDDNHSTRFATELILRKSRRSEANVKLRRENCDTFTQIASAGDPEEVSQFIEEAKKRMEIGPDRNTLHNEVLRVEICGPEVPHLTLVDLPGSPQDVNETQGNEDAEIANRLAGKYMSQESGIILAVVSASTKLATQKILEEVTKHDPKQKRTLGIVTKPDEVEEGSEHEQQCISLVRNEHANHKLALGWHVLRNPKGQYHDNVGAEFFQSGAWNTISHQDRGPQSLRWKLSRILHDHLKRKLPAFIGNLEANFKQRNIELEGLGDRRTLPKELHSYLMKISSNFHSLALDGVRGNYVDKFFGGLYLDTKVKSYSDLHIRKLHALVGDLNNTFCFVIGAKGKIQHFEDEEGKHDKDSSSSPEHIKPFIDLYSIDGSSISLNNIKTKVDQITLESQSTQFLGSPGDKVTLRLLRDQSKTWETISIQHVNLVADFAKSFVEKIIFHITKRSSKTATALLNRYVDPFFDERKEYLHGKVAELLESYKTGYVLEPLRADFKFRTKHYQTTEHCGKASLDASSRHSPEQAIDAILQYYKISLGIFAQNVMTLALHNCLISCIPGIFTPNMVLEMCDQEIKDIAAESPQALREREALESQIAHLKRALVFCRRHWPRESVGKFMGIDDQIITASALIAG
ncbi:P-loop containing nucleoside triphosphate hydrolase protein [Lasiosphaeria hispida]|uniref:P-loop containing nucleoside triphosphate hydrolase protein n=1 Tax=Lasiosphaeria hispida TaxID=260671 RepID=A0AAJ0ME86_9PEZI|nr:P-loop containing nucleoside triphosphate hydrolase protein [Lasiosphaeria hispida]